MTLQKGSASKAIRDAIEEGENTAPASTDITDATTTGKALLTAASAAAARTALGATSVGSSLLTATDAAAARTALSVGEKVAAPASAAATGTTGQWATDTGFFYSCTATNTWKRVAIATW